MKLGDKVTCTAILKRQSVKRQGQWGYNRSWEAESLAPQEGIYIGQRTLSNGVVLYSDDDLPEYLDVTYLRAALVVFSERQNPVYVPLDALYRL